MAPSALTAEQAASIVCGCSHSSDLQRQYRDHTLREHAIYVIGERDGWALARDTLLKSLQSDDDPAIGDKVREILG